MLETVEEEKQSILDFQKMIKEKGFDKMYYPDEEKDRKKFKQKNKRNKEIY